MKLWGEVGRSGQNGAFVATLRERKTTLQQRCNECKWANSNDLRSHVATLQRCKHLPGLLGEGKRSSGEVQYGSIKIFQILETTLQHSNALSRHPGIRGRNVLQRCVATLQNEHTTLQPFLQVVGIPAVKCCNVSF